MQGWRTGAWDLGCVVLGVHVNCLCGQFVVFIVKNLDLPKLPMWKKRECIFTTRIYNLLSKVCPQEAKLEFSSQDSASSGV